MKKVIALASMFIVFSTFASQLIAGSIDHVSNQSAEYVRSLSRNAATDAIDAVVYNPAGVVRLEPGFYVSASVQSISKEYSHTVDGEKYATDNPVLLPGAFLGYNSGEFAAMLSFTVIGGGGTIEYNDGSLTTAPFSAYYGKMSLKAITAYPALSLGAAYAINDFLSLSLSVRSVNASYGVLVELDESTDPALFSEGELEYEETANGMGGVLGVDFFWEEQLNVTLRYETSVPIEFERNVISTVSILGSDYDLEDGKKRNRDLPALFAFGVAYYIIPELKLELDYTLYMNASANWDEINDDIYTEDIENGTETGFAVEYALNPSVKFSVGYLITRSGMDVEDYTAENPKLDANSMGGGVELRFGDSIKLDLGYTQTTYISETNDAGVKYEKSGSGFALGIQARF